MGFPPKVWREVYFGRRQRQLRCLVLPVESCPEDIDRASVTVERRVSEELVIQREVNSPFRWQNHNTFPKTSRRRSSSCRRRSECPCRPPSGRLAVRTKHRPNYRQTEGVAGTVPCGAFDAHAQLIPSSSASVYVDAAYSPSCQPSRENMPTFFAISCSQFTPKPYL